METTVGVSSSVRRRSRTDFCHAVSTAVDRLESQHGYSRERATGAILREILSAAFGAEHAATTRCWNDDKYQHEVYCMMKSYGMSNDQAHHALKVSRAFEELCRRAPGSDASQVLDSLTERLGKAHLLEHGTTTTSIANTVEASPRSTSRLDPRKSGLLTLVRSTSSTTKKPAVATNTCSHRKRPFAEASKNNNGNRNKASTCRSRSDSVTEQVSAKLAAEAPASAAPGASNNGNKSKRPRLEDTVESSGKRVRLGSNATLQQQTPQQPNE